MTSRILLPLLTTALLSVFCSLASAGSLPTLDEKDWISYHALHRGRGFAMGVDQTGALDLYFIKRGAKTNRTWPIQINLILERRERSKGSKWVKKTIRKNGFTVKGGAKLQQKQVEFIGSVTGDVKFRMLYKFHPKGVTVTAKLLDNPDDADYRLSLTSDIGDLVNIKKSYSQRDIRKKTKGYLIIAETRTAKPLKIKFHEKTDLKLLDKNTLTGLTLKAPKIGRVKLIWKLADPKLGKLQLNYTSTNGLPHKGFTITTSITDKSGKPLSSGLTLEVD